MLSEQEKTSASSIVHLTEHLGVETEYDQYKDVALYSLVKYFEGEARKPIK